MTTEEQLAQVKAELLNMRFFLQKTNHYKPEIDYKIQFQAIKSPPQRPTNEVVQDQQDNQTTNPESPDLGE